MRFYARPRHLSSTRSMNKLEGRYAKYLDTLKLTGEIAGYHYEHIKLRLAYQKCWYTPDFLVIYPDRVEIHETKGKWEDDARVKIKVAATTYPWFVFKAIREVRKQWVVEEIKP